MIQLPIAAAIGSRQHWSRWFVCMPGTASWEITYLACRSACSALGCLRLHGAALKHCLQAVLGGAPGGEAARRGQLAAIVRGHALQVQHHRRMVAPLLHSPTGRNSEHQMRAGIVLDAWHSLTAAWQRLKNTQVFDLQKSERWQNEQHS